MIRFIICMLILIIVFIVSAVAYPLCRIVRKKDRHKGDLMAFHFVQFWLKIFAFACITNVTYKGLENIPEDGDPVVYVGNHRSYFDIILTYPKLKGLTGIISKKEMGKYPLLGWWLKTIYGVFLDRSDIREGLKCILEGIGYIGDGISMLVFPEGTRGKSEGEMLPFHKGSFKLATKPGVRIVPVAITNTGEIFDDHKPFIHTCPCVVEFCEPIETKGLTREEIEELPDKVHAIILKKIRENAEQ